MKEDAEAIKVAHQVLERVEEVVGKLVLIPTTTKHILGYELSGHELITFLRGYAEAQRNILTLLTEEE